jgi:hypothetical protein
LVRWDPSERSEQEVVFAYVSGLAEALPATGHGREHGLSESHFESWDRCARRARRGGHTVVKRDDLLKEVRRDLHFRRAFAARAMSRVVTTIHSAKNQEWDDVVVLWSQSHFRAATPDALKRRLLYNAVTRAKRRCVIVVDGPAYKWVDDPVLGLLKQPPQHLVASSRPKNPGARRRRRRPSTGRHPN